MNQHSSQPISTFWAEMTPCEHFVQIYENDALFLDTLAEFIAGGLNAEQSCVVIATPEHRSELHARLEAGGIDVASARAEDRLISLDAEETMSMFMRNGWPDDRMFTAAVTNILRRATAEGRKVRAFGEMVALMWARGDKQATIRLEQLWTELCRRESFALFCAYPKIGFTENAAESIKRVCATHSKVLAGEFRSEAAQDDKAVAFQ